MPSESYRGLAQKERTVTIKRHGKRIDAEFTGNYHIHDLI